MQDRELFTFLLQTTEENFIRLKVLKKGEKGTVSLLRHRETGQEVVLHRYRGRNDVYEKLLGIQSPSLPRVLNTASLGDDVLVLEEYIRGDSLADMLEGCLFSHPEARRIMLGLCEPVWILHSLSAVHRDIKPANVILRGDTPVLIDFDASRVNEEREASRDTHILGTTGYASPEQYGFARSDARTDIFAMGVLYNVLLTGEHPSARLADGRAGRIIRRCTMTNPDHRYQNVLQLRDALI